MKTALHTICHFVGLTVISVGYASKGSSYCYLLLTLAYILGLLALILAKFYHNAHSSRKEIRLNILYHVLAAIGYLMLSFQSKENLPLALVWLGYAILAIQKCFKT